MPARSNYPEHNSERKHDNTSLGDEIISLHGRSEHQRNQQKPFTVLCEHVDGSADIEMDNGKKYRVRDFSNVEDGLKECIRLAREFESSGLGKEELQKLYDLNKVLRSYITEIGEDQSKSQGPQIDSDYFTLIGEMEKDGSARIRTNNGDTFLVKDFLSNQNKLEDYFKLNERFCNNERLKPDEISALMMGHSWFESVASVTEDPLQAKIEKEVRGIKDDRFCANLDKEIGKNSYHARHELRSDGMHILSVTSRDGFMQMTLEMGKNADSEHIDDIVRRLNSEGADNASERADAEKEVRKLAKSTEVTSPMRTELEKCYKHRDGFEVHQVESARVETFEDLNTVAVSFHVKCGADAPDKWDGIRITRANGDYEGLIYADNENIGSQAEIEYQIGAEGDSMLALEKRIESFVDILKDRSIQEGVNERATVSDSLVTEALQKAEGVSLRRMANVRFEGLHHNGIVYEDVTMENCHFIDCTMEFKNPTFDNCNFLQSTIEAQGTALAIGSHFENTSVLDVNNILFDHCSAKGSHFQMDKENGGEIEIRGTQGEGFDSQTHFGGAAKGLKISRCARIHSRIDCSFERYVELTKYTSWGSWLKTVGLVAWHFESFPSFNPINIALDFGNSVLWKGFGVRARAINMEGLILDDKYIKPGSSLHRSLIGLDQKSEKPTRIISKYDNPQLAFEHEALNVNSRIRTFDNGKTFSAVSDDGEVVAKYQFDANSNKMKRTEVAYGGHVGEVDDLEEELKKWHYFQEVSTKSDSILG